MNCPTCSTDPTTIRSAALADAPGLAILSGVLSYPVAAEIFAQRLGRLLTRDDNIVLVAEAAPGHVVGWLHGEDQELLESGRRCEILGLVVDAAHRGQGVGRRLVAAVEEWATRRGLEQMAVRSNVIRTESHPFYERLGYARAKTQHAYRKHLAAAALACFLFLSACRSTSSPQPPQAQIEANLRRYSDFVLAMDHAGIAALFAPEGEIVNPGQPPIHGPVAIQAFLSGFSAYNVLFNSTLPTRTVVSGDRAVQEGTYHQRVRTPDGQIVEVSGTFEAQWVRGASGQWLILRMGTKPDQPRGAAR